MVMEALFKTNTVALLQHLPLEQRVLSTCLAAVQLEKSQMHYVPPTIYPSVLQALRDTQKEGQGEGESSTAQTP